MDKYIILLEYLLGYEMLPWLNKTLLKWKAPDSFSGLGMKRRTAVTKEPLPFVFKFL
ncbi:hypothetical protein [Pedobacter frigiditerrae]|uniref:hypothetical protein n=1 Tax=Pedobacter frigiditerrae TaxID=2530452 RepID=UPI002930A998|nr:hypothetical protein [Pedobacter frigiditerrae]